MESFRHVVSVTFFYFCIASNASALTDDERIQRAMKQITVFAEEICVPNGHRTEKQVRTKVDGLINDLSNVARISSEGININTNEYSGVLRSKLEGKSLDPVSCKLNLIAEWKKLLLPDVYNVVIQAKRNFINNRRFGRLDGSLSTLALYVDNKLIIDGSLDEPFPSKSIKLTKGNHTFKFEADLSGSGDNYFARLEDNCEGEFDVEYSMTLSPSVTFEKVSDTGTFPECSLEEK